MKMRREIFAIALSGLVAMGIVGCQSASKTEQTAKEETEEARKRADEAGKEVSQAVKNAKPELNKAGEKVGQAARTVADDANAAVRGAKEGWDKGRPTVVNLNSASEAELVTLPGIGHREAKKIIAHRPYVAPDDTVRRGALTEAEYEAIEERVTAK
ncbi:MAG TPA: helix-hairpin-helix domain-containing protein [Candidatus Dormibacteraeota bacterium]|nr:helix-hairpin-helix domain-containing protein [Candidatus Dormibacteraeota bacterium]